MDKSFFSRPNRMVFRFGQSESRGDPLFDGRQVFAPKFPVSPSQLRSGPLNVQQHGEYRGFSPPASAIVKPNGRLASNAGPQPDYAEMIGAPIPASTKKRRK